MGFQALWTDREGNPLEEVRFREQTTSVTMNTDAQLKLGAEMSVYEIPGWVKPGQHRVALSRDGVPLGLYRAANLTRTVKQSSRITRLRLADLLSVFDGQVATKPISFGKGQNVVAAVVGLIEAAGENRLAVTPSTAVLAAPQVWKPGEKLLTVINELLGAINYWGLRTNRLGQFVIAPYTMPEDRPVTHEFIAGDNSLMLGEYNSETDLLHIPNRFVAYCEGYEEDDETLVGVAENHNPDSEFSYEARGGVWVDEFDTVEATSQKDIDAIARRRLEAYTGLNQYVNVTQAFIPDLWMDSRVYAETGAGDVIDATIKEMTIGERGLVDAVWKKVQKLG